MKKRWLSVVCIMALTTILAACGNSGSKGKEAKDMEVVELTFSGLVTESAKNGAEKFIEVAERESGGTIKIKNFPDNQLGDDRVVFESTCMGDIDIAAGATSPLANVYTDFYLFDAPYLYMDREAAYASLDGEAGKEILKGMDSIGLKGLGFWENGFRNLTNSEKVIKTPADIKGIKLRTMENDIHLEAWKAMGANPTPMAGPEVFTALQQGTIDGQENPYGVIDGNKFYEVQKFITETEHVYTPFVLYMNLDKYNSLTDDQKAAINKAAEESTKFQREENIRIDEELKKKFEDSGVEITALTEEEKAAFKQLIIDGGVYELVKEKMDHPEFMDTFLE